MATFNGVELPTLQGMGGDGCFGAVHGVSVGSIGGSDGANVSIEFGRNLSDRITVAFETASRAVQVSIGAPASGLSR